MEEGATIFEVEDGSDEAFDEMIRAADDINVVDGRDEEKVDDEVDEKADIDVEDMEGVDAGEPDDDSEGEMVLLDHTEACAN